MARSINIGELNFKSFSMGTDSFIITFNDTKKDPTGEKVSPKNIYANHSDFRICPATATGLYLAVNDGKFANGRTTLFQNEKNTQKQSASHAYCDNLVKLFEYMGDKILQFVRPGHAASHGTRKGAAVHCTSGTTCPPPMTSVARRGEWSLGKIYEIYWLWAESGDQYCGRILVGYDPMSTDFDSIPPHFIEGLENEFVKQAMERTYPNIYQNEKKNPESPMIAILMRCLASIVHHSDVLIK